MASQFTVSEPDVRQVTPAARLRELRVLPLTAKDVDVVEALEARIGSVQWHSNGLFEELSNPNGLYLGVFVEGKLAGYAGAAIVVDEVHIATIGVDPDCRERGLGAWMLLHLLETAAAKRGENASLEVRSSNQAAIGLYKKFGFRPVNVRRGYYSNPDEDGLIMTIEGLTQSNFAAQLAGLRKELESR